MSDRTDPKAADAAAPPLNEKVLAESPALAMGAIYQSLAHSTGLMFVNAVNSQNSQNLLQEAATGQGVVLLYDVDALAGPSSPRSRESVPRPLED